MTKGERICNPGCIRDVSDNVAWKGKKGVDSTMHVIFDSMPNGCRALWRVIQQKIMSGNNSPLEFCRSYADAKDTQGSIPGGKLNEPDKYCDYLCRSIGIGAYDDLTAFDMQGELANIDQATRLFRAISRYENSGWVPKQSDMFEGLAIMLRDKVEK